MQLRVSDLSQDLLRWGPIRSGPRTSTWPSRTSTPKPRGSRTKPTFRDAFERRRCLVPVDNFYEWRKIATGKQPYAIALADRGLMALAGLWENWRSPAGEWVRSF